MWVVSYRVGVVIVVYRWLCWRNWKKVCLYVSLRMLMLRSPDVEVWVVVDGHVWGVFRVVVVKGVAVGVDVFW